MRERERDRQRKRPRMEGTLLLLNASNPSSFTPISSWNLYILAGDEVGLPTIITSGRRSRTRTLTKCYRFIHFEAI